MNLIGHSSIDYIDGSASKPHISIFDKNEILAEICFDTNLYEVLLYISEPGYQFPNCQYV